MTVHAAQVRLVAILGALLLVAAACGGSSSDGAADSTDGDESVVTGSSTQTPTPEGGSDEGDGDTQDADADADATPAADDEADDEADATPTAEASATPTPTPPVCAYDGDPKVAALWPNYSAQDTILADARIGANPGFDRFVLEFDDEGGTAPDSYVVQWSTSPPLGEGSGEPVAVAGTWFLEVRMTASMYDFVADEAYDGPTLINPAGTVNVVQAASGGSFEGYMLWGVGANQPTGFNVALLSGPPRFVIDICTGGPTYEASAVTPAGPEPIVCAGAAPGLPADASISSTEVGDLDGDGIAETTTVYFMPGDGKWHIRVQTATSVHDEAIEDSGGVFESRILDRVNFGADSYAELLVQVEGGAYTQAVGVYQFRECNIVRTTFAGSGTDAAWYNGASVSNALRMACAYATSTIVEEVASIGATAGDGSPLDWDVTVSEWVLVGSEWQSVGAGSSVTVAGAAPPLSTPLFAC